MVMILPFILSHVHLLQTGVGAAVEALDFLFLQPLQQMERVLVHATSLGQHQRSGSIVIAVQIKKHGHEAL